jgi:hypothetical protein
MEAAILELASVLKLISEKYRGLISLWLHKGNNKLRD